MALDYLIALDFETTCFPSKNQSRRGWYQEIIEFGAVLIDLQTSNLEAEFQCYVQPTDFPYLTQGCVNALGIYQDDVDDALPLKNVLHRFYNWIDGIRYDYDLYLPKREYTYEENAFFCTWSNADLGTYLRKECSNNKDIPYANYLKWWINGQEIYRDVHGYNAPGNLLDAANYLETPIFGNAHSALDDAKTLAVLTYDVFSCNEVEYDVKSCY